MIEEMEAMQDGSPTVDTPPVATIRPSGRFKGMTRGDAAYQVLKENGLKMTVRSIVDALKAEGFKSEAKHPTDSMRAAMRRDRRFTRLEPFGAWGLVEWEGRFAEDGTPVQEPVAITK